MEETSSKHLQILVCVFLASKTAQFCSVKFEWQNFSNPKQKVEDTGLEPDVLFLLPSSAVPTNQTSFFLAVRAACVYLAGNTAPSPLLLGLELQSCVGRNQGAVASVIAWHWHEEKK